LVRDALSWSHALDNALDRFGGDAEVLIDQHQWPVWGNKRVREKLENHRDLYKYIHDQTLRMMNEGMGPNEIADAIAMPPGLEKDWAAPGYYGNLRQDAKAVYQKYIGWYDGNPANLDPLPRVEEAKKIIEYMGGPDAVIARARDDLKAGNYRWVAEVMDRLVFADPSNRDARALAADAFEQMGYLAQSAPWRNSYLKAAQDLRKAAAGPKQSVPGIAANVLHAMSIGQVFDYLGTRIDGPRAGTRHIVIDWRFTDSDEVLASTLEHGALTWIAGKTNPHAAATVTTTRAALERVILGRQSLADALTGGEIVISGDAKALPELWSLLVSFETGLPLVAPS